MITPIIVGLSVYLAPDKDRLLYAIISFLIMCVVNLLFFYTFRKSIATKNDKEHNISKNEKMIGYLFFLLVNFYGLFSQYFLPSYMVFLGILFIAAIGILIIQFVKQKPLN
ncbi:MAG: hypothetical protein EAY69_09220 [Cytophagales bacterium]|nr:MAG: hypothetical protein EAY69_09220 [Cytophagales bacterium]